MTNAFLADLMRIYGFDMEKVRKSIESFQGRTIDSSKSLFNIGPSQEVKVDNGMESTDSTKATTTESVGDSSTSDLKESKSHSNQTTVTINMPSIDLSGNSSGLEGQEFGLSSKDLLYNSLSLSFQSVNMSYLLSKSYDVRANNLRPIIIQFNCDIQPDGRCKDKVAAIRIHMDKHLDINSQNEGCFKSTELLSLFPMKDSYNVMAISNSTKGIGFAIPIGSLPASVGSGRYSGTSYVVKDIDTIGFQEPDEKVEKEGETKEKMVFGWYFRPVLGRHYVEPGMRTVYAVVSVPYDKNIEDENNYPDIGKLTYKPEKGWVGYDSRTGIILDKQWSREKEEELYLSIPKEKSMIFAYGPQVNGCYKAGEVKGNKVAYAQTITGNSKTYGSNETDDSIEKADIYIKCSEKIIRRYIQGSNFDDLQRIYIGTDPFYIGKEESGVRVDVINNFSMMLTIPRKVLNDKDCPSEIVLSGSFGEKSISLGYEPDKSDIDENKVIAEELTDNSIRIKGIFFPSDLQVMIKGKYYIANKDYSFKKPESGSKSRLTSERPLILIPIQGNPVSPSSGLVETYKVLNRINETTLILSLPDYMKIHDLLKRKQIVLIGGKVIRTLEKTE
jgi:hypothetical protein